MSKPSLWSESASGHDWIASQPTTVEQPPAPPAAVERHSDPGALWSRIEIQLLVACAAGAVVGVLSQVLR